MSTELAVAPTSERGLTIYDRVDPMQFITDMGKVYAQTGAGGCKTEAEGKLMALICLSERKTIFEIATRYHLMDGKLVTKAEAMLAHFRRAGGEILWLKNGSDGKIAELELTLEGVTAKYSFTIETAHAAGYIKDKSNWVKRPDQMLRSRCITDLIRMQWPEFSDGHYSDDEIADEMEFVAAPAKTTRATRSKEEVEARAAELKATQNGGSVSVVATASTTEAKSTAQTSATQVQESSGQTSEASSQATEVVDAEIVSGNSPTNSESSTATESRKQALVMEVELGIGKCGWKVADVLAKFNAAWKTSFSDLTDLAEDKLEKMAENVRKVIEQTAKPKTEEPPFDK